VPERYVLFNHGLESTPWGKKISALAETARGEGYKVESIDYRGIADPEKRVQLLVESCRELRGELVLVGSSLGAWVAAKAASTLHARGLFLMAPAIYREELAPLPLRAVDCPLTIVHGWQDDVVPVEHSVRFAREHRAALIVLNDNHVLHASIRHLKQLFEYFLVTLDAAPDGL
jgi:alpha/beta superfamily hydrolase